MDLHLLHRHAEGATPLVLILVRNGKAEFLSLIPQNKRVPSLFQSRHLLGPCVEQLVQMRPAVLHLNTVNHTLLDLLNTLPDGTRYSMNLRHVPDHAAAAFFTERLLRHMHLLVLSDAIVDDWLAYFAPLNLPADETARCAVLLSIFFHLSPTLALGVVTCAERGLVALTREGIPFSMPAYPVHVVDPTGAGDTLIGTLLAGLLAAGWTPTTLPGDVQALLEQSAVAAALICGYLGATAWIPPRGDVDKHLTGVRPLLPPRECRVSLRLPRGCVSAARPLARLNAGIPAAVQQTLGRQDFSALRADFARTTTLVCVGSGSSFSVAVALARLAARLLPAPYTAHAYRPGEYLALGRARETVVCLTQRGNPDIEAAAAHARGLGVASFLLTAHTSRWTRTFANNHVFWHTGESVRSFVNARGPCAALALGIEWLAQQAGQAAPTVEEYIERYERAWAAVERLEWTAATAYIALASGLMLTPLHELDLKAAEASLTLESYEIKGWTHGRYQRVWTQRADHQHVFLTLETPADAAIVTGLAERCTHMSPRPVPFYRLCASDDALGLWQHLVHVMLLIERLAPTDPTAVTVPLPLRGINRGIVLLPAPSPLLSPSPTSPTPPTPGAMPTL